MRDILSGGLFFLIALASLIGIILLFFSMIEYSVPGVVNVIKGIILLQLGVVCWLCIQFSMIFLLEEPAAE